MSGAHVQLSMNAFKCGLSPAVYVIVQGTIMDLELLAVPVT